MIDNEKMEKLEFKLALTKERTNKSIRLSQTERDKIKSNLQEIADGLSQVLEDESISMEVRETLAKNVRKQVVIINQSIENLQRVFELAREMKKAQ